MMSATREEGGKAVPGEVSGFSGEKVTGGIQGKVGALLGG